MASLQNRCVEILALALHGPTNLEQISWLLTYWERIIGATRLPVETELSHLGNIIYAAAIIRTSKSAYGDGWSGEKQLRAARKTVLAGTEPSARTLVAARSLG